VNVRRGRSILMGSLAVHAPQGNFTHLLLIGVSIVLATVTLVRQRRAALYAHQTLFSKVVSALAMAIT